MDNNTVRGISARHSRRRSAMAATLVVSTLVAAATCLARPRSDPPAATTGEVREPWTSAEVMDIPKLARLLSDPHAARPLILCVGFPLLFDSAHIPGARFAGPASEAKGLDELRRAVARWPRQKAIVLYCGCCPFRECPNIRPAFKALRTMGYVNLMVLRIPRSFAQDWVEAGLPVAKDGGGSQ